MKYFRIIPFYKYFLKKTEYSKVAIALFLFIISIKAFQKKKVGVICIEHSRNIGNNLSKYAMFILLSKLGYDPYIIGKRFEKHNISFIQKQTKLILINNSFSEIKENDYDILIVNSDQTWRKWSNEYTDFYDIAFLKFAEKWIKPKFVYGASLGRNIWEYNKTDEKIAKSLLKNFKSISVREKGAIELIRRHLGFTPYFVLDPTLLIDKKYYLNLVENYNGKISTKEDYILIYTITNLNQINLFIRKINETYNYKLFCVRDNIEDFIYGIYYSKGLITDSFHGTLFSIIFNKPFIAFAYEYSGKERFNSLKEVFNLGSRIYDINSDPDITLLEKPLYLNKTLLNLLKIKSIDFLKQNLKRKIISFENPINA